MIKNNCIPILALLFFLFASETEAQSSFSPSLSLKVAGLRNALDISNNSSYTNGFSSGGKLYSISGGLLIKKNFGFNLLIGVLDYDTNKEVNIIHLSNRSINGHDIKRWSFGKMASINYLTYGMGVMGIIKLNVINIIPRLGIYKLKPNGRHNILHQAKYYLDRDKEYLAYQLEVRQMGGFLTNSGLDIMFTPNNRRLSFSFTLDFLYGYDQLNVFESKVISNENNTLIYEEIDRKENMSISSYGLGMCITYTFRVE